MEYPKKELLAMGEGMRISTIAMKAIDRNIETFYIWMESMMVYSWFHAALSGSMSDTSRTAI